MMTKKIFNKVAIILADRNADKGFIDDVADMFQNDNPRFDRQRFLEAISDRKKKIGKVL